MKNATLGVLLFTMALPGFAVAKLPDPWNSENQERKTKPRGADTHLTLCGTAIRTAIRGADHRVKRHARTWGRKARAARLS